MAGPENLTMLRYAIEKLSKKEKEAYLKSKDK